jgi:hypothetical protein
MTEKMIFVTSGRIKDKNDIEQIEFWGHDAGEFFSEEVLDQMDEVEILELADAITDISQSTNHE